MTSGRIYVHAVAVFVAFAGLRFLTDPLRTAEAADVQVPLFEVDPLWPKPLPNHWVLGSSVGVAADSHDHVWMVHRASSLERMETYATANPPAAECCAPAPPVLEFAPDGTLVRHWGGPGAGYDWPAAMHGITVDHADHIWLGSSGSGDNQILKFTPDGKFLLQIGRAKHSTGSNDVANLNRPAKIFVDHVTNEVYAADGYGNRRVIVFDAETGMYKRHWGAYGNKPDDTNLGAYDPAAPIPSQFRNPVHCAELSNDGLLYVCDRINNRIQVFRPDGTFVKEARIAPETRGDGAVYDIAFSRDARQRFIYLADGSNQKVHILSRDTLEVLTSFGDGGRQPGQFYAVHSIATDSKGNIYTTEAYRGQRLQKFVYKGLGTLKRKDQGVVWPKHGR